MGESAVVEVERLCPPQAVFGTSLYDFPSSSDFHPSLA